MPGKRWLWMGLLLLLGSFFPLHTVSAERLNFSPIDEVPQSQPYQTGSGTGTISGWVTDQANGQPLADVQVKVSHSWGGPFIVASTCTDPAGTYTLSNLAFGREYFVQVIANGSACGTAQNYLSQNSNSIMLTPTLANATQDFSLSSGGTISGLITDAATGLPLINIPIHSSYMYAFADTGYGITCTNSNGEYTLTGIPFNNSVLRVNPSYGNATPCGTANNAYGFMEAEVSISLENPNVTGMNFALDAAGIVNGQVVEEGTNLPLPNVEVSMSFLDPYGFYAFQKTLCTDAGGNYAFAVPDGFSISYILASAQSTCGTSDHVMMYQNYGGIMPPATLDDLVMTPGGSISGTVTDQATGQPLANVPVTFNGQPACTDANGQYTLHGVPLDYGWVVGTFIPAFGGGECAFYLPYTNEFWQEASTSEQPTLITVTAAQPHVTGIDLTLQQVGGVSGFVYESDGITPITNVQIELYTPGFPYYTLWSKTAADGSYYLEHAAGTYYLRARHMNMADLHLPEYYSDAATQAEATPVILTPNSLFSGVNFTLDLGGEITGYVYDVTGTIPLMLVRVQVEGSDAYGCSNYDGSYQISQLPANVPLKIVASASPCFDTAPDDTQPEWWQNVADSASATPVTLLPGEVRPNINFSVAQIVPVVANDFRSSPQVIPSLPATYTQDVTGATRTWGETCSLNPSGRTVWYSFTADSSDPFEIRTTGSGYATELVLYENGVMKYCSGTTLREMNPVSGATYELMVGRAWGDGSNLQLTITHDIDTVPPEITLTAPSDGTFFPSNWVTVHGNATDAGSGIDYVVFYAYYIENGLTTADPHVAYDYNPMDGWQAVFNLGAVMDQSVTFTANAYDIAQNIGVSSPITIVMDRTPPVSNAVTINPFDTETFTVFWYGFDPYGLNSPGVGVAAYDVQVSIDGGEWTDWLTNVTENSALFTGENGKNYAFRSRARDWLNIQESYPETADTNTTVSVATISGTVYNQDGIAPLEGVTVALDISPLVFTCTDVNGAYNFDFVTTGQPVSISAGGYGNICTGGEFAKEWWEETSDYNQAEHLTLSWGETLSNIDFTLGTLSSPSDLTMTANTETSITLGWQDNTETEDGFRIYQQEWNGLVWAWVEIATTAADVTTYTDTDLFCSTTYSYQVTAYNVGEESEPTSPLEVATASCSGVMGTISGTLGRRDTPGPLNDFPVYAWDANNSAGWSASTCSDANGNYSFTNVPVNVDLNIRAGSLYSNPCGGTTNYGEQYWDHADTYWERDTLMLTEFTPNQTGINFMVLAAGRVTAQVYADAGMTAPLANAPVTFYLNNSNSFQQRKCTDANGIAVSDTINHQTPVDVVAGGSPQAWQSCYASAGSYVPQSAPEFTVDETSETVSFIVMEPGGTLTGRITNTSGTGIRANISATYTLNGQYRSEDIAGVENDGDFILRGIPFDTPVTVYTYANWLGYATEWWNEKPSSINADTITLTVASPTQSNVNFTLAQGASVTGVIYAEDGVTPLPNVYVRAEGTNTTACSNASGQYTLSMLGVGDTYIITAGGTQGYCSEKGYSQEWWQDASTSGSATPLTVVAGGNSGVNFTLSPLTVSPPAAPTITAPAGVVTTQQPEFTWTAVTGATSYHLYLQTSAGTVVSNDYYDLTFCNSTACLVPSPVMLMVGETYSAWVRSINSAGSTWSEKVDFTVSVAPPALPMITAPAGVSSDTTPEYAWTHVSGATSYRLFISDAYGATLLDTNYSNLGAICPAETCTVTPDLPLADGTYSVWVQALNAGGGIWSTAQVFTIYAVNALPAVPVLTAPLGFTGDTTPTYTWNAAANTTSYRVYVQAIDGTVLHDQTYGMEVCSSVCAVDPGITLTLEQPYQFWVQSQNEYGSAWSDAASFYVGTALPAAAVITAPLGGVVDTTPTYTWNTVSAATQYRLYVQSWEGVLIHDQVYGVEICSGGVCTVDPGIELSIGMTYNAWVLTSNAGGNGPWSDPATFAITNGAPSAPTLIAPTGSTSSTQPTYQWNEATGATVYRLYVQEASGTLISNELMTNSICAAGVCSYMPAPTLITGTGYTWWVLAANDGGGAWSDAGSFVVGSLPGTVTITAPVSPTSETQPAYAWTEASGATTYRLYIALGSGPVLFDQTVAATCAAGVCSYTPALTLTPGETYQVWVLAGNASGYGGWAGPYFFSVNP